MENITTVMFFNLCGFQETWMNKSLYFPLALFTYLLIITLNVTLSVTIIMEKSLHDPMYIFICNLSINALYGTFGFYPIFLNQLLADVHVISYAACFTQTYVIYTSVICETTTLTVMAFDRYVAICKPLHYHAILAPWTVGKLLLIAWLYPLLISILTLSLTLRLPLCGSNIDKVFCDNSSLFRLSCIPVTLNRLWSNFIITVEVVLILSIVYSYCQITKVCIRSAEGRMKFTQTCVPHLMTLLVFLLASLFDFFYGWYDNVSVPLSTRSALAVQFLVIPPVLNPIIYGLNIKQIQLVFVSKCKDIFLRNK